MKTFYAALISIVVGMGSALAGPKAPGTLALLDLPPVALGDEEEVGSEGRMRQVRLSRDKVSRFSTSDDGTAFLAIKIALGDLKTAQAYLVDFNLDGRSRLYLYGIDKNGNITDLHGPYSGAGPQNSGEFWTGAVSGTHLVFELQSEGDAPSELPFAVAGIAKTDQATAALGQPANPEVRTSIYQGVQYTHAVEEGLALIEGDIILGAAHDLRPVNPGSSKKGTRREAVARTGSTFRWPGGIIPYSIDPSLSSSLRVTNAIAHWNTKMAGYVTLVPRTTETNYVTFYRAASGGTCSSSVGMTGGRQLIYVGDSCSTGNVIHEIGHTVGLWHEQGREDRNAFVRILYENVKPGYEFNFSQYTFSGDDIGQYDYGSIMHYPRNAFSRNGQDTVQPVTAGVTIGQRVSLSAKDIAAVQTMYSQTAPPTTLTGSPSITLKTNPAGLDLVVDGQTVKTPVTLAWTAGSVHTISALDPPVVSGVRRTFLRWTDGATQSRTVTTPTVSTTYQADFTSSYLLTASAASPGTLAISPAIPDGFYPLNTVVRMSASAPSGYCFTGWTGLLASTPPETSVLLNKYTVVNANFASGAITVPAQVVVPAAGGVVSVPVTSNGACSWNASLSATWIGLGSLRSGIGSGVVSLTAAPAGTLPRTAELTVGGQKILLTQHPMP